MYFDLSLVFEITHVRDTDIHVYVDYILRSLNIYVCWLWIYVCLSKISCLLNI